MMNIMVWVAVLIASLPTGPIVDFRVHDKDHNSLIGFETKEACEKVVQKDIPELKAVLKGVSFSVGCIHVDKKTLELEQGRKIKMDGSPV
jgi:hypothetical protein